MSCNCSFVLISSKRKKRVMYHVRNLNISKDEYIFCTFIVNMFLNQTYSKSTRKELLFNKYTFCFLKIPQKIGVVTKYDMQTII